MDLSEKFRSDRKMKPNNLCFDLLIVGAGLAGMSAALQWGQLCRSQFEQNSSLSGQKNNSLRILRAAILEKNRLPGKKLLISGSGQCNITHSGRISDFFECYGSKNQIGVKAARQKELFLTPALQRFPNSTLIQVLEENGIPICETEKGKIFPKCGRSRDILDLFLRLLELKNIPVLRNCPVIQIDSIINSIDEMSELSNDDIIRDPFDIINEKSEFNGVNNAFLDKNSIGNLSRENVELINANTELIGQNIESVDSIGTTELIESVESIESAKIIETKTGLFKKNAESIEKNAGKDVEYDVDGSEYRFRLEIPGQILWSKSLILAVGGCSYPETGSSGDAVPWLKKLGVPFVPFRPALTSVAIRHWKYVSCSGMSFSSIRIELFRGGKKIGTSQGDVLFTHQGLSGPGILDFSRCMRSGDELRLCLVDFPDADSLDRRLSELFSQKDRRTLKNILTSELKIPDRFLTVLLNQPELADERNFLLENSVLPSSLNENRCRNSRDDLSFSGNNVGKKNGSPENNLQKNDSKKNSSKKTSLMFQNPSEIKKETRKKLAKALTEFVCPVASLGGFREAMVSAGGVDLADVDRKTMMSRTVPGLFFAGEILDIDGNTGGYNLQFAFSSGSLAGESAFYWIQEENRRNSRCGLEKF